MAPHSLGRRYDCGNVKSGPLSIIPIATVASHSLTRHYGNSQMTVKLRLELALHAIGMRKVTVATSATRFIEA